MINITFPLSEFKCWHCKHLNSKNDWKYLDQKQLKTQCFLFWKCLQCQNNIYYFIDRNNKYYFVPKIHVVLHQPEIPGNVGTIIRLAVAFDFDLHLIEPFGFIFCEKWLRRSSTNHFRLARIKKYHSFQNFLASNKDHKIILTSSKTNKLLPKFDFTIFDQPLFFVFGCESKGLPEEIVNQYLCLKIPHLKKVSSINVANAVSIFVYCAFEQFNFLNLF